MLCYAEYGTPDHFLQDCNLNLSVPIVNAKTEPRTLVKILDFLGRETRPVPNTTLIYLYSDGTSEKVFRVKQ